MIKNIEINDTQTLNNNTCSSSVKSRCTIALLHNTPLTSTEALFKAFHLINKEWPLANSGALLQRLKLIGSSQNILNSIIDNIISDDNNLKTETDISLDNNFSSSSKSKSNFQLIYKNIPHCRLPFLLPFSIVAYLEEEEEEEKNNSNKSNINNKYIKIIGHSRWALAKPVLFNTSNNSDIRQVLMDSCKLTNFKYKFY